MGVNTDGRRELLGLKVGESENEGFWSQFVGSLKERGLTGIKLVISNAQIGLIKAIRGCCRSAAGSAAGFSSPGTCSRRCRRRKASAKQGRQAVVEQWDQVSAILAAKFPRAAELMGEAREDVLALRHFSPQQWEQIRSTNQLDRDNEEIKRRTRVGGVFPNDAAIERLVGAVLLEQDEHWQPEGQRMFFAGSKAEIPAINNVPDQASLREAIA